MEFCSLFCQDPGIPYGAKQTQSKEQSSSSSREIEKVVERETDTGGGGQKEIATGESKKEENVKEGKFRLPGKEENMKEGKFRLPGKEEFYYRSWEEGNEADPWVVIDLKIVEK